MQGKQIVSHKSVGATQMNYFRKYLALRFLILAPAAAMSESHVEYNDGNDTSTSGLGSEGIFDHYLPLFLGQ